MATHLYWFSGTGNSLWLARQLAARLGDAGIFPMLGAEGKAPPAADAVGVVFPVYVGSVPSPVRDFLERLARERHPYVFAVCNSGGMAGGTLNQTRRLLAENGIDLALGYALVMPANYTPFGEAEPEAKQTSKMEKAQARLDAIAEDVKQKRTGHIETANLVVDGLLRCVGGLIFPSLVKEDKHYTADDTCVSCGLCEKVCPVGNIEMRDGRPAWKHVCAQCWACVQWCPQEAIQYKGARTRGKKRYHHPDITAADMETQAAGAE